jgi:hypothetical protein
MTPRVMLGVNLAAWGGLSLLGGCVHNQAKPGTTSLTANSPPAPPSADSGHRGNEVALPTDVPIRYDPRLPSDEPTREQIKEILSTATPACPNGQRIWYIWVRGNHRDGELGYDCVATVYFTPEVRGARLRKGHCCYTTTVSPGFSAHLRSLGVSFEGPGATGVPGEYWQISLQAQPFGEEFAVPEGALLPFAPPTEFTEAEVIEIIDFVRTGPGPSYRPEEVPLVRRFDGAQPICWIRRDGTIIEVHSGTIQWPRSGGGEYVRIKKTDQGFLVVEAGRWVS